MIMYYDFMQKSTPIVKIDRCTLILLYILINLNYIHILNYQLKSSRQSYLICTNTVDILLRLESVVEVTLVVLVITPVTDLLTIHLIKITYSTTIKNDYSLYFLFIYFIILLDLNIL